MDKSDKTKNDINEEKDEDLDNIDECATLMQMNKVVLKSEKKEEIPMMKKKRKRGIENTDISYDAKKKKLINCFCPSPDELKDFLEKCEIREIKDINEINNLNISDEDIFDPDEFIKNNFKESEYKSIISGEDLNILSDIKDEPEDQEIIPKEIEKKNIPDNKIKNKSGIIGEILNNEILNINHKKNLNELISKIKNMDIKNIIKKDNILNIVFDLDETCIYSFMINPEKYKQFKNKNNQFYKLMSFSKDGKKIYGALIIRKKLSDFIQFTKDFCKFHISTLGFENYGKEIKKILQQEFDCDFIKFQAKDSKIGKKKFLKNLELNIKDTLIFDDNPNMWIKDNINVIISKKFIDKDIMNYQLEKQKTNFYLDYFLKVFEPFCFYKSQKNKYRQIIWKEQKLYSGRKPPFYYFKEDNLNDNVCYSGEYFYSSKHQFTYMKDIIKIIYYFVFYYGIYVSDAIKLIRYNIFYNTYFYLKFYKGNGDGDIILKNLIEICGGQIIENNKNIDDENDKKIFFVCRKDNYAYFKDQIEKELIIYENAKVVSDIYILDSFFFMTNLESELEKDSDYLLYQDY